MRRLSGLVCFCFGLFPPKKKLHFPRANQKGSTLTEVVVVFRLSGVADLLDIDVRGSSRDPHHCVITWKRGNVDRRDERMKRIP